MKTYAHELREASETLEQEGDRLGEQYGEVSVLGNLANVYGDQGQVVRAAEAYDQALAIFRMIPDTRGVGITLSNLARSYAELGETAKAVATYREALVITRELADPRTEAAALWNLSLIQHDQGEKTEAIKAGSVALNIFRGLDAKEEAETIHRRLVQWQQEGKISS